MDIYRPQPQAAVIGSRVSMREVMQQVYLWMMAGLGLSALVAVLLATVLTEALVPLLLPAVVVELVLVLYLSMRITKMSAERATTVYLAYAALNGVTLATIFFWASLTDIWLALFATGAMFAAMSIIGFTTNIDLSGMRSYLLMGLIGLIVASVINIFWASSALYWIVTYAGVLLFVALTAYDTQWIKRTATEIEVAGMSSGEATVRRVAIIGALKLYLDFINLFLYILRIVSDR
jgi:FtsH-binding integral membrane protein